MNILFDTNISSVRPVYPRTPLNGARMFPLFNLINISPFLTKFFNFKSSIKSSFLILKVFQLHQLQLFQEEVFY